MELKSFEATMNRVKEEPPEEFVLVIPAENSEESAQSEDEEEEDIDPNCTQFNNVKEEPEIDVSAALPNNLVIHEKEKLASNQSAKLCRKQIKRKTYATAASGTFDCDECDRTFSNSSSLRYHKRKVHDEVQVKCEVCGKICKNQITLKGHKQNHIKVSCSICHKMLGKCQMTRHLLSHSGEKPFECDLCEYSTITKTQLRRHIERIHLLKKLVSDSNREGFTNFELLQELQLKHGNSKTSAELKFKCDQCEKFFVSPNVLNCHKHKVHPEKLIQCPFCEKAYKSNHGLQLHTTQVHKRSHTAAAAHSNFHLCSHCQHVFGFRRDLIRHLKTCSKLNPARFACDLCGERFCAKWRLRLHMKTKHSREKKFHCIKCGFGLASKKDWLKHSRSKRFYKCADCEAKFFCKLLIVRHRIESHGKVLKCDKCSKQTAIKKFLASHRMTHVAPIACQTCQKNFSRKNLKRYQRQQQHGIFATPFEETSKSFSSPRNLKLRQTKAQSVKDLTESLKSSPTKAQEDPQLENFFVSKPKLWVKSVKTAKFDAKRPCKSTLFETFLTCPRCQLAMKFQSELASHMKSCDQTQ